MKERKIAVKKFLILMICASSLLACKNGDKDSGGWFSGAESIEPPTAAEIEKGLTSFPEEDLLQPEQVNEFYSARKYAPIWVEADLREAFLSELQKAEEEGLFFKDYHGEKLQELADPSGEETQTDRVALEVLLTDAFLNYGHDLFYGKVDPKDLYSLWGLCRKDVDIAQLLQASAEKKDIKAALDSLRPSHEIYEGLKTSLKEYKSAMKEDSVQIKIEKGDLIEPGEKDARMPKIVSRLQQLGMLEGKEKLQDSTYTEEVAAVIKKFQEDQGLDADGVIGNSTLEVLNKDDAQRYNQILVNLERWRWYPRDLGDHYILVNIADFKLAVVKDGDTVRTHNVIAGSKARQTPVFTDTLEYIVINPQWNIPPTIQSQDIIPKASRNPSYLANNNMTVTAPNGERLNPHQIDWSSPEVKNYRFTQSAGPSNPLGRVKIIYPNQYLIYLHDTPAKSLFNRADRAESSGCVRVENAIELSGYVVEDQEEWKLEDIKETIASGKTKQVKINRPIQVHHFYWTAWRGRDKTFFADDVYSLDQEVYEALTSSN